MHAACDTLEAENHFDSAQHFAATNQILQEQRLCIAQPLCVLAKTDTGGGCGCHVADILQRYADTFAVGRFILNVQTKSALLRKRFYVEKRFIGILAAL